MSRTKHPRPPKRNVVTIHVVVTKEERLELARRAEQSRLASVEAYVRSQLFAPASGLTEDPPPKDS